MKLVKPDKRKLAVIKKLQYRIGVLERRSKRKRSQLWKHMDAAYDLKNWITLIEGDLLLAQQNLDRQMGRPVNEGWRVPAHDLSDQIISLLTELPPPVAQRVVDAIIDTPSPVVRTTPAASLNVLADLPPAPSLISGVKS